MNRIVFLLVFLIIILTGCNYKEVQYVSPQNYYSEAEFSVFSENSQNKYDLKIYHNLDKYKIIICNDELQWDLVFDGVNCKLDNSKFKDNPILINNMNIIDKLIYELDLSKFEGVIYNNCEDIRYCINDFKYVLELGEESLYPKVVCVYKDNQLIKKINYRLFNTGDYNNNYNIRDNIIVH